jgi:hypothetical protein
LPDALVLAMPPAAAAVTSMIGGAAAAAGPFAPWVISRGISVDVVRVVSNKSMSPVPVAAVVSPNVMAAWLLVVCAQFQICAPLFPLAMVLAPVAAVIADNAEDPPPVLTQDHECVVVLYRSAPVVHVGIATAVGTADPAVAFITMALAA